MNNTTANSTWALPHWMRPWEQFWFTPADPSLWALIRVSCGVLMTYTLFVYSFTLQEFMGEHAWHDMQLRMNVVEERPVTAVSLTGSLYNRPPNPKNDFELKYYNAYLRTYGAVPPPPYPRDDDDLKYLEEFQEKYKVDVRLLGLPIPRTPEQKAYAELYTLRWRVPPPAYPKTAEENNEIEAYMERQNGNDPRLIYGKGMPVFSIWFHVLDPQAMMIIHLLFVLASLMFTLGLCTRMSTALTWFANLCYIHRNPTVQFGADTMFTILMLYLMLSPCGEVFSLDRVIRRWWRKAKPGFVQGWYRFWSKPIPSAEEIAPVAFSENVPPSVSANVAIRLLQIHLCVVYGMSGLAKLLGQTWWNGTAIWGVVANFEFAPMQYSLYLDLLQFMCKYRLLREIFLTGGGLFTLTFEISYPFLIWRPSLRRVFLAAALLLHLFIGVLMGLKTFALIMVVMNMAFLRKDEVLWLLSWIGMKTTATTATRAPEVAVAVSRA